MHRFYVEMKFDILGISSTSDTNLITTIDIKNLKTYRSAPEEYRTDFDDSILGGRTMGRSATKVKAKTLNSQFLSSGIGETSSEYEYSDIIPMPSIEENKTRSNQPMVNTNNHKELKTQYYYKPSVVDPIDELIA